MKVLVVGGAGYIGSHVGLELQLQGHDVTVFDNFYTGRESNLQKGQALIRGDLDNPDDLDRAFSQGFDAAIHLAAYKAVGESMAEPEKYSRNNITGTLNLLAAMAKHRCHHLVFSSTAAVYGEPAYVPIDEKHPTNPENFYGFTKLEIEKFLGWYDKLRGIKSACLRYFNAAGYDPQGRILGMERNPANLLPIVAETAAGIRPFMSVFGNDYPTPDGSGIRDYVHVTDLAKAHVLALDYIRRQNQSLTVNLGSESGISVLEMVETARRITGRPIEARIAPRRPGDPARVIASSSEARRLLGWKAELSDAENLIRSTWEVYKKNTEGGMQ